MTEEAAEVKQEGTEETAELKQEGTEDAAELKQEGNAHFKAGKYQASIDAYTRSLELDPQQHLCYSNRSAAYLKLGGSAEQALQDAEKCVEFAPTWPKGYSRQAAALQELKRWDEALAACERGIAMSAEDKTAAPDQTLQKMVQEVQNRRFQEKIKETWHGTVSEALGGYEQEMEFLDDARVRVDVMGRSIVGRYTLNCSSEPHHLDIQVPMAQEMQAPPGFGQPPPVPYIAKVDEEGLHLCCPYVQTERPSEFKGEGYCLMRRGPLATNSDDSGEIAKLSEKERFLFCAREVTNALPNRKIEEPQQTESEEVVRDKLMAQVRFESSLFTLQKRFGEDTLKEVIAATKDPGSAPAALKGTKELEELRKKLLICGVLEGEDAAPSPPPPPPKAAAPVAAPPPPEPAGPDRSDPEKALQASANTALYVGAAAAGAMAVALAVAMLWRKSKR